MVAQEERAESLVPCEHAPKSCEKIDKWNESRWKEIKDHRGIGAIIHFNILYKCIKCGQIYEVGEKRKVVA